MRSNRVTSISVTSTEDLITVHPIDPDSDDDKASTPVSTIPIAPPEMKFSKKSLKTDLEPLGDSNAVCIKQIPQRCPQGSSRAPRKYELLSTGGFTLYDIIESNSFRGINNHDVSFTMLVMNNFGECVLELIGNPGVGTLGTYVKVKRNSTIVGKVIQTNGMSALCSTGAPTFYVQEEEGKPLYKIKWERGRTQQLSRYTNNYLVYSITCSDRGTHVGNITRRTKDVTDYSADLYSLNFYEEKMERKHKALFVAAVIMIDVQLFEEKEPTKSKLFCCL